MQTIPSKRFLLALFRAGVLSVSFELLAYAVYSFLIFRCTSSSANLDNDPSSVPRTHTHTDALRRAYSDNLKDLWDGYGVVGDVIVSIFLNQILFSNKCSQLAIHIPISSGGHT